MGIHSPVLPLEVVAKKRGPAKQAASQRASPDPTREKIAARAYEIFITRGGQHGRDVEDWLRAESELRRRRPPTKPAD